MSKGYSNPWFKFGKYFVLPMAIFGPIASAVSENTHKRQLKDLSNNDLDNYDPYKSLRGDYGNNHLVYQNQESISSYDKIYNPLDDATEISFIEIDKDRNKVGKLKSQNTLSSKSSKKESKNLIKETDRTKKAELDDSLTAKDFQGTLLGIKDSLIQGMNPDQVNALLRYLLTEHKKELGSEIDKTRLCESEKINLQNLLESSKGLEQQLRSDKISVEHALESQTKGYKAQITKAEIYNTLEYILDTKLLTSVIVDIKGNMVHVVGRPPVSGSSTKQMNHVTPFSFIKHIIQDKIESTDNKKLLFEQLQKILMTFLPKYGGLCLYSNTQLTFNFKASYDILEFEKGYYYLINSPTAKDNKKWLNDLWKSNGKEEALCQQKKQELVLYTLNYLTNKITDLNTYIIASEAISRFIFILFNQKTDVAFPAEGNNINNEIRLYFLPNDATTQTGEYSVIKPYEIVEKIKSGEDINGRIRIASNEGNVVKQVITCLKILDDISLAATSGSTNLDFEDYKTRRCHTELKLSSKGATDDLKAVSVSIKADTVQYLIAEIAKQLYIVFDYKNLENFVFIQADLHGITTVVRIKDVYSYVTKDDKYDYIIADGKEYRGLQKADAVKNYNRLTKFREEEEKDEELLGKLLFQHIYASVLSFKYIFGKPDIGENILNKFIELIKIDYGYDNTRMVSLYSVVNGLKSEIPLFNSKDSAALLDGIKNEEGNIKSLLVGNLEINLIGDNTYDDNGIYTGDL